MLILFKSKKKKSRCNRSDTWVNNITVLIKIADKTEFIDIYFKKNDIFSEKNNVNLLYI